MSSASSNASAALGDRRLRRASDQTDVSTMTFTSGAVAACSRTWDRSRPFRRGRESWPVCDAVRTPGVPALRCPSSFAAPRREAPRQVADRRSPGWSPCVEVYTRRDATQGWLTCRSSRRNGSLASLARAFAAERLYRYPNGGSSQPWYARRRLRRSLPNVTPLCGREEFPRIGLLPYHHGSELGRFRSGSAAFSVAGSGVPVARSCAGPRRRRRRCGPSWRATRGLALPGNRHCDSNTAAGDMGASGETSLVLGSVDHRTVASWRTLCRGRNICCRRGRNALECQRGPSLGGTGSRRRHSMRASNLYDVRSACPPPLPRACTAFRGLPPSPSEAEGAPLAHRRSVSRDARALIMAAARRLWPEWPRNHSIRTTEGTVGGWTYGPSCKVSISAGDDVAACSRYWKST